MNRKQQVARVQFCVAAHLRKVGKKDGNGCLYRVLCVELLDGRADDLRKQNSNWLNEGYFPDKIRSWCAAGTDFDSSGDSEKAVHPLRWEETS